MFADFGGEDDAFVPNSREVVVGAADHTAPAGNPPATTAPKPIRCGCHHAGKLDCYGVRVAFTTVNNRDGMVPVMLAVTVVVPGAGVFRFVLKFTVVPPAGTPAS